MPRREDPYAAAQTAMPFLGAVEGASLEASVARMQRQVEGLGPTQLRQLVRDMRTRRENRWMVDVAVDALVQAVLAAPEDGEHLPDADGTYHDLAEMLCVETNAVLVAVHGTRTRWGHMAKWRFEINSVLPDGVTMPHPNVTGKAYPTATGAIGACLAEIQEYLADRGDPYGDEAHARAVAAAVGRVAEMRMLHAARLPLEPGAPATKKRAAPVQAPMHKPRKPARKAA